MITKLPSHNPVMKFLYVSLLYVMIIFFGWIILDKSSLQYVGSEIRVNDFESCEQAGGEIYENRCYISETEFFTKN